ncbi:hypothetical protein [Hydrogenophaga sp.]|uniref:hypothetical protein n=1 Tax=Hydrogenophaga sp. TaxID=1904254 RepID=UPI00271827EE|nr:hypothetical protein [Hydrogenophaga sp.]MDO9435006.1 hypothetical protein [Hydrogenophaga sp.]
MSRSDAIAVNGKPSPLPQAAEAPGHLLPNAGAGTGVEGKALSRATSGTANAPLSSQFIKLTRKSRNKEKVTTAVGNQTSATTESDHLAPRRPKTVVKSLFRTIVEREKGMAFSHTKANARRRSMPISVSGSPHTASSLTRVKPGARSPSPRTEVPASENKPAPEMVDVKDAATVLHRAAERDQWLAAAAIGPAAMAAIEERLPSNVLYYYFPFPVPRQAIRDLYETVKKMRPDPRSSRMEHYLSQVHFQSKFLRRTTVELANDPVSEKLFVPVKALCELLRDTHETDLHHKALAFDEAIAMVLKQDNLETVFACQPYANLRTLQHKCVVLEVAEGVDTARLRKLMDRLVEADTLQRSSSKELYELLMTENPDVRKVGHLAMMQYAMSFTLRPLRFLSAYGKVGDSAAMSKKITWIVKKRSRSLLPHEVTSLVNVVQVKLNRHSKKEQGLASTEEEQ